MWSIHNRSSIAVTTYNSWHCLTMVRSNRAWLAGSKFHLPQQIKPPNRQSRSDSIDSQHHKIDTNLHYSTCSRQRFAIAITGNSYYCFKPIILSSKLKLDRLNYLPTNYTTTRRSIHNRSSIAVTTYNYWHCLTIVRSNPRLISAIEITVCQLGKLYDRW